ncbi:MAG: hypothetical protein AAGC97_10480 [Planctomycetota bacterium]
MSFSYDIGDDGDDDFDFQSIESAIAASADFVGVSNSLRPKILESVRGRQRRSPWLRWTAGIFLSVAGACCIGTVSWLGIVNEGPSESRSIGPTTEQLHESATLRARQTGVSLDWALSEVIQRQRANVNPLSSDR